MATSARLVAAASLCGGLLLATGCDSTQPDRLLAPESASPAPAMRFPTVTIVPGPAIGAQAINTVIGSFPGGVLLTADPVNNVKNFYTFFARRAADGTATGTFNFVSAYDWTGVYLSGTIVCYTVVGNQARIGGIVTASSFPEIPVGTSETWSITDNGTATSGTPDTGSSLLGGNSDYARAYCADGLPYEEHPYLAGGVQITY